jgi:hypothetical protein
LHFTKIYYLNRREYFSKIYENTLFQGPVLNGPSGTVGSCSSQTHAPAMLLMLIVGNVEIEIGVVSSDKHLNQM